ncbi:MAG TPA: four helix bundle protein [Pyrinomonadaceae bacterium]|nr:four helix bundle protein [Pyrinomonadaceae bacterium]
MNADDMKKIKLAFALRVNRLAESLPNTPTARVIRNQMVRCGTSVGANYRAACRAKSRPDFIAKLGIVEEEADESNYWIELLIDAGIVKRERVADLLQESNEIVSIVVSSIKTGRTGSMKPVSNSAIRIPQSEIV